ncbi:hypothetical protein EYC80_000731 [Monilinia laxa]|uniref:BTB domain-containing protein n=1 Tax=Monilinia laxa TaxID=61186 RepID=A0A5N6K6X3_MONLA|nr:hypothetical protein EYC80_000731 [Monilinia laxa]
MPKILTAQLYSGPPDQCNSSIAATGFRLPESDPYRCPDSVDTFATYKFRNTCNISSLDLHAPFGPLCSDRQSMLTAMASGGRIGFDAPYIPRGCDFRWFTSEEICEIFGRFEKVVIIGDSMLRHVLGSFNIFLRKDMGYGAVTDWNFNMQEREECFCNEQFDVKACSVQGIYKTSDVEAHDPGSISCSNSINVMMEEMVFYSVPEDEISRLRTDLLIHRTSKPVAIVFGHGLWSDLDLSKTIQWLDTLIALINSTIGLEKWKGLFVTPNAAGKEKADEWIVSQGNKALMLYEEAVGIEARKRGLEHLGTWNMSIQARKYDGGFQGSQSRPLQLSNAHHQYNSHIVMACQNSKDEWPLDEKALGTEFVTVQVGKQKKEVAFHKKLLSSRSTAFENHMKVLKEKGKYQFHCEPRFENAFSILVTYLYKGYVPACPVEDGPESSSYGRQMRELYHLAERFEIIDLMDKTMDAIQAHDCQFDRDIYGHMTEVYKNTTRKSSLRFYCALSAAWYLGRPCSPSSQKLKCLEGFKDKADILYDVMKSQLRYESSISNTKSDYRIPSTESGLGPCAFHAHSMGEICQRLALLEPSGSSQDSKPHKQAHTTGIKENLNSRICGTTEESVQGSVSVSRSPEVMDDVNDEDDLLLLTQETTQKMITITDKKKIKKEYDEEENGLDQLSSTIIVDTRARDESPILGSKEDTISVTGKRPLETNDEDSSSRKRSFVIIGANASRDRRSEPTDSTRETPKPGVHAAFGIRKHLTEESSTIIKPRTSMIFNHSNGQITTTRSESNHPTSGSVMSNYGLGVNRSKRNTMKPNVSQGNVINVIIVIILGIETATICNNTCKEQEITFHTKPLTRLSHRFAQFCRRKKQPDGRFTLKCAQNKYYAFTCIALYAYHGKVPTPPKDIDTIYTRRLRWIYYVAEEFALNDLMNKTIDALRFYDLKYKQEIHVHAEEIYKNTSKGSLLRWYSAASAAWSWGRETGPATSSQRDNRKKFISSGRCNPDIFADFHLVDLFHRDHIRGFDTDWRDVQDSGLPVCAFHCHAPGETCHRTGITEPAEVPEHISKTFDSVEDSVLLDRSQIIDAPSDQEMRSNTQQSTPPRSPETNIHQKESLNVLSADAGSNACLLGAGNELIRSGVAQSDGGVNEDPEATIHQAGTAVISTTREREQATIVSSAIPLASIRNPSSTRVVPPENGKINRSHKDYSEISKDGASAEDLYDASDIEMDCKNSRALMKPTRQVVGSATYDEQLADAWRVPLSSLPPKKTRIVPGTVTAAVKSGDSRNFRAKHAVADIHQSPTYNGDIDENKYIKAGTKRKAIANGEEINQGPHSAISKKSRTTHVGTQVATKSSESHKMIGKIQSEIQDSETESSSEEDTSDHSPSEEDDEEDDEEDEDEDEDDEMNDNYSSDEEESSYQDEESMSQARLHHNHDSSDNEVEDQEPGQSFIDSGIHSHTSSKATSTSILIHSQPSFNHQGPSNTRTRAGIAPLRPGYCLIYNYKGRCNKACGLQHLCLKCDLQHSSLHHDKYQPNFRAVNPDSSIETCPDWNAGRCAVRVTNCTLRHICSICKGGHRSIYHEHEGGFPKNEKPRASRTAMESNQFRHEGRLDHHSQAYSPQIPGTMTENWSEPFYSPSHREPLTQKEETSGKDPTLPLPFASCQMWQRGTCIRKKTRCQLAHICERCGQLTHRTAKHDTYMSKTAPRA